MSQGKLSQEGSCRQQVLRLTLLPLLVGWESDAEASPKA